MLTTFLIFLTLLSLTRSHTQETTVSINDKPVVKLSRKLRKPDLVEDLLFKEIFKTWEKIVPNIENLMYKMAKDGVTVDSLLIALKVKGNIPKDMLERVEQVYEYVCAKVYYSPK